MDFSRKPLFSFLIHLVEIFVARKLSRVSSVVNLMTLCLGKAEVRVQIEKWMTWNGCCLCTFELLTWMAQKCFGSQQEGLGRAIIITIQCVWYFYSEPKGKDLSSNRMLLGTRDPSKYFYYWVYQKCSNIHIKQNTIKMTQRVNQYRKCVMRIVVKVWEKASSRK